MPNPVDTCHSRAARTHGAALTDVSTRTARRRPASTNLLVRTTFSGSCRARGCGLRRTSRCPHPKRGFLMIPNPVHDLGANASLLGTSLWTTVGNLWINLAQARVVHAHPELSQGSPQALSPGLDTSRRGGMRVIHTIHRTYYYDCYFSLRDFNKEKQGVRVRTRVRREVEAKVGRGRLEPSERTLYGCDQRLVLPRGGVRERIAPRVWKGLS
jgi:hypothetical protein